MKGGVMFACAYCGFELLSHERAERVCGYLCDVCVPRVSFAEAVRVSDMHYLAGIPAGVSS